MQEEISIEYYVTENDSCPFLDWERKLSRSDRARVRARLARIRAGNFGDYKPIKDKKLKRLYELRLKYGSGYRIYFGKNDNKIVILLCGGDKSSQNKDIAKAKKYWQDCLTEEK